MLRRVTYEDALRHFKPERFQSGSDGALAGVVYWIFCHVTGKSYVGATRHRDGAAGRWLAHSTRPRNNFLGKAIREHGPEAFTVRVVAEGMVTDEKLREAEERWIAKIDSIWPRGYNSLMRGYSYSRHANVAENLTEPVEKL
jgi:hypothetical protein